MQSATELIEHYAIGHHTSKEGSLLQTVQKLQPGTPYQIFIAGSQNVRFTVKDADIAAAAGHIAQNNLELYIHSPYLINLSAKTDGDWNLRYMEKLLRAGAALGAKGVVVHTGKHTKEPYAAGVEKMRVAIAGLLPFATPECPLLLETPAGQGTETLLGMDEFLDFVASFASANIAVCVDTCHVFAKGHDPLVYVKRAVEKLGSAMRLVHYNDSMDRCGSCKDRHAMVGTGHIGLEKMGQIAELCHGMKIPMVIE